MGVMGWTVGAGERRERLWTCEGCEGGVNGGKKKEAQIGKRGMVQFRSYLGFGHCILWRLDVTIPRMVGGEFACFFDWG